MNFIDWQRQAAECLEQDKYSEAIALYSRCIQVAPDAISNYWLLGLALLLQGEEVEAQAVWLSAIVEGKEEAVESKTASLINLLETEGLQRLQAGKYQEAEKIYYQILEQEPSKSEVYKNLGNALFYQGELEAAKNCYSQAINLDPHYALPYYNMGIVFQMQDKLEPAIAYYEQSITLNPKDAKAYDRLGLAFQTQGQLEKARDCYEKAILLEPDADSHYFNLAYVFQKEKQIEAAIEYSKKALQLNPKNAEASYNLGCIFQAGGEIESAIDCYKKVIELNPEFKEALSNLGLIYMKNKELKKAKAYLDRAIEIAPDYPEARWNRAMLLLREGDYKNGFVDYEWRWAAKNLPCHSFPQPVWDGSDLQGRTILIHQIEQGLGDTIQFIRYVPLVQQRGGNVVIECQNSLVELLSTIPGIDKVVAIGTTLPEFDVHASLMSLPYILGTTLETIPAQLPYLLPPVSDFELFLEPETKLKIGILWAPKYRNQVEIEMYGERYCPLSLFIELLTIPGISLYSLQFGRDAAAINQYLHLPRIQDLSNFLHGFANTASVITKLDLVISVDTSAAHLAGALGKPVWVLLPFECDWRWMRDREDSPWYPTMRLFRQNRPGDWAEVFSRVLEAASKLIATA